MEFETERERKSGQEGKDTGKRRNGMEGLIIGRDCKELTELEIICNDGTKRI
jgi:hypothetical protein